MDDKLTSALKSLPRERAGAGFTAGVLRRLDERRRPTAAWWGPALRGPALRGAGRWPLMAAAAAVLLLAVGLGAREWWHFHQRQQATARLATLEQERQALAAELAELRRRVVGAQPVVYLGGSNDLDLVLDLAHAKRAGTRPEDVPEGLLRAYRLGLSAPERRTAVPAYAEAGSAAAGVRPARLDEGRTRTIY